MFANKHMTSIKILREKKNLSFHLPRLNVTLDSSLLPFFYFTHSLQTPLSLLTHYIRSPWWANKQHQRWRSVHSGFFLLIITLFLCSTVVFPQDTVPSAVQLLCHGEPPPLTLVFPLSFLLLLLLLLCLWYFLSTKAPPTQLMGSAVSCIRTVLEILVVYDIRQTLVSSPRDHPCSPPLCQKFVIYTKYIYEENELL